MKISLNIINDFNDVVQSSISFNDDSKHFSLNSSRKTLKTFYSLRNCAFSAYYPHLKMVISDWSPVTIITFTPDTMHFWISSNTVNFSSSVNPILNYESSVIQWPGIKYYLISFWIHLFIYLSPNEQ